MPSAEAAAKPDTTVLIATDIRTDADAAGRALAEELEAQTSRVTRRAA